MEDSEEKIVVYASYNSVVEANLVKTKLDAYGIPCFLSDENSPFPLLVGNQLLPGVRLHIFEHDRARVTEILSEEN